MQTVSPPGDEAPLAELYVAELRQAGIEAVVVPTPSGSSQVGRAAAWGRRPGMGSAGAIVLLSHLDVVPADPSEWTDDPFAGVQRRGRVIGRGALDAKGVGVVQLLVMQELVRRQVHLERDVIFLATPDEETGGRKGAGWLLRQRPDLVEGARFLLTEGGSVLKGRGGRSAWQVAFTEKSPCWLRVKADGPPGHSSAPPPTAAVTRLLAALESIRRYQPPIEVVPEVERMFAALAAVAPAADAAGFADLRRALADDPDFRERFLAEPSYAALVRNTLAITVLEGSARTNVLPARASAHVDARLLPGQSCEELAERLRQLASGPGVSIETLLAFPSQRSRTGTPLFRAIEAVATRSEPGAIVVPYVVAGFTDAHYFRAHGIKSYGFVPRWHRAGETRGIHGPNESISVENLTRGVETLIEILVELDRQDAAG